MKKKKMFIINHLKKKINISAKANRFHLGVTVDKISVTAKLNHLIRQRIEQRNLEF